MVVPFTLLFLCHNLILHFLFLLKISLKYIFFFPSKNRVYRLLSKALLALFDQMRLIAISVCVVFIHNKILLNIAMEDVKE